MDDKQSADTRARILRTALDLFAERGYTNTSMQEIAARLEITKPTVFYHFPSKALLLATLCEPLTEDLEEVIVAAEAEEDLARARRDLIEGTLDVYIRHRRVLRLLLHDLTLLSHDHSFRRLVALVQRSHKVFSGPEEDVTVRIRGVQIFAMLSDPVMFFEDLPVERLRAEILAGVWAMIDGVEARAGRAAAPAPERPARRRAGRPSVMDAAKAARAREMYATGAHSVGDIAARLGVSRATVYRHLDDGAPS
ncbi:TetR family transcriptional regulator [Actinomadura viridis]|uniref:TetR family transcriptional regulator n=1 Tax=Actinomadura viridis TaxID=58110 RepID=UPI003676A590